MHTGKSYRLGEFMFWTRRSLYILLLVNAIPVLLYQVGGLRWLVVPWDVVLLLGSTVALLVGLRSLKAYNRMREAENVWSSIVNGSRAWSLQCRDLVGDRDAVRQLLYRHLAWLTALRYEMRAAKAWEVQDKPHNVEYMRKHGVPERERPLYAELARYVSGPEAAEIVMAGSRATRVISLQSQQLARLQGEGRITASQCEELRRRLMDFVDRQGASELVKEYAFPRQYAFVNKLFLWLLCLLLPLGMIGEVEAINAAVGNWIQDYVIWAGVPLGVLVSWMYASLNQVVESTENPFEGGANDVPISRICEQIEKELRETLGETAIPESSNLAGNIAV